MTDRDKWINHQAARTVVIILFIPPVSILLTALCFYLLDQLFDELVDGVRSTVAWFSVCATCFAALTAVFNEGDEP
jgi:fructose-specific phosphotransferase system IIC component